ncbi:MULTISPECIES: hypothetical protein [Pseudomonas]|uniref:hypothetical protein n=1 Tax=Pseudomonas TaxID=286 RepID=UPI001AE5899E|nr:MULTISPECIES: hypothetical protein [unclassified Pseudomonas]MBP1127146.1 hypothetical protein [Pseudomonas sp. PvP025]MDQ0401006.1 hypothetical protein [Pseudomonas sp. PvP006]
MLKTLKWQKDLVLSVQVEKDLFTLAQMRENYLLEFFDVFRCDENWEGVDLNSAKIIFCIFVSPKNIKSIFSDRAVDDSVIRNNRPVKKRMLSANFDEVGGADLIDLSDKYSNIDADLVKAGLTLEKDLDLIYEYDLCGMAGSPEKILNRLKIYFDTGVNWDPSKKYLFPGIEPPQPSR